MENINQTEAVINTPVTNIPAATSPSMQKQKLTPTFKILENAILVWWKNLNKILKVYWEAIKFTLIPLGIILVLLILNFVFANNVAVSSMLKVLGLTVGVVALVFAIYFSIRAYMGVYLLIGKNYEGEAKEIFKETKDLFWPYIGLSLLTALLIIGWTLLLIIPGIIFSVLYSFAVYAFFFEGERGMEAIKSSRALVKGYFWPVVGRILLLSLILWVVTAIIAAPLSAMTKDSAGYTLWNTVVQIFSFLIGPIAILFSYNIYTDLVKIKK
jgi:hypothetical protein